MSAPRQTMLAHLRRRVRHLKWAIRVAGVSR